MESKLNKKGAGARPFILSLMLVVLGGFLIVSFVFNFIKTTNPTSDIFNEQYGLNDSANRLQNSLNNFTEVTNNVQERFEKSNPTPLDYVFLIFEGAFWIPWTVFQFVVSGILALAAILTSMFGGSIGILYPGASNIIGQLILLLIAGVILTGIFLLIKAIRGGETER